MAPRSPRPLPGTRFVEFDSHQCQACWSCIDACPKQVIGKVSVLWHKHAALRKGKDCIGCFKCVAVCRGGAAMDQLLSPRAIALSPDGKWIYVVDAGNNRIQQWASASS